MKNKIKILNIIQTLNPAYGGIATPIVDISAMLINNGFKVDILTYDNKNISYVKSNKVKIYNKGPGYGKYTFSINLFLWLLKNRKNYDYFIIHGIWHFSSLISRILLKNNYFVFLHGGLDPYFSKNFFKKIKKIIYWNLIEKKNLLNCKSLLLTTNHEKRLLDHTFVNTQKITKNVVGYGIAKPKINKIKCINLFYKKFPYFKDKRFLLFLGRFDKKKGLEILINSIKKLSKKNIKITLLLVGQNNAYKDTLKVLCKKNRLEENIFWSDLLIGDLKWGSILASSGMVLSSHGENFGVSLAESLSCSKPVLTTYKVNIYDHIIKYDAGLISKNTVPDFTKILEKFHKYNDLRLKIISKNSLICFNKEFNLNAKNNTFSTFLKKQYNDTLHK